jgi:hypothetical protein
VLHIPLSKEIKIEKNDGTNIPKRKKEKERQFLNNKEIKIYLKK